MPDRLATVRAMLRETPDDPFLRFALAQELCNAGQLDAGAAAFEALRRDRPDYTGLYFHLGVTLLELGRREEALATLDDGIARARAAGEHHDADAMRNVRTNAMLGDM